MRESPVFSLGPDTAVCPGGTLLLDSGLDAGQYGLQWQNDSANPTLEVQEPGAYILTATNDAGCTRSDTLLLSLYSLPEVNLGPDTTLCGASSLEIIPQTGAAQPIYQWSTAAVTPRLTASSEGLYALTVTDAATGCAGQDSLRVSFAPPLLIRQPPDTPVCPDRPVFLEIQALSGALLSLQWEDGSADNPYAIQEPGDYSVQVSNGACDTTLSFSIFLGDCRESVFLPNAFSPNDDGRNDFFLPLGPDIELTQLQVAAGVPSCTTDRAPMPGGTAPPSENQLLPASTYTWQHTAYRRGRPWK